MATGKIITQSDNGRVERLGGRGYYLVHMYEDNFRCVYRSRKLAIEAFDEQDITAIRRRIIREYNARLIGVNAYGEW